MTSNPTARSLSLCRGGSTDIGDDGGEQNAPRSEVGNDGQITTSSPVAPNNGGQLIPVVVVASSDQCVRMLDLFQAECMQQGRRSEKNSGGLKGSEGETRIRVESGVLLGGESSQKL